MAEIVTSLSAGGCLLREVGKVSFSLLLYDDVLDEPPSLRNVKFIEDVFPFAESMPSWLAIEDVTSSSEFGSHDSDSDSD